MRVVELSDGSFSKHFVLRARAIGRVLTLGKYPEPSLAEAFKNTADWGEKIAQGIDPAAEELVSDVQTFEKLIYD